MKADIVPELRKTQAGARAEGILRKCVHCGFCNATCPTYQLLGDELDGPRGRIYLIKSLLEGREASAETRKHLDRCLTCRACETTCPSGVEYGALLDIGREQVERTQKRSLFQVVQRGVLKRVLPHRRLFTLLLRTGQWLRPVLPSALRKKIPPRQPAVKSSRTRTACSRRAVLFQGCVQPAISPETNRVTETVLDRLGIDAVYVRGESCCGALHHHLGDTHHARKLMRRNIDRWWPLLKDDDTRIITTASGCGVMLKEYGDILADDPDYRKRASEVAERCMDVAEFLAGEDMDKLRSMINPAVQNAAFQCPCTLQHGQKLSGVTESFLAQLGLEITTPDDAHLCCGSAGTYSILQPGLSSRLRQNKLEALMQSNPESILTANIGCQAHLQQGTAVPVRHWITVFDDDRTMNEHHPADS